MKNLTQIADELRGILSELELIIGEKKEDSCYESYYGKESLVLNPDHGHADTVLTVADFDPGFEIVLDNTKKD